MNGSIKEVKSKGNILFSFFNFYTDKGDRTSHWVSHSDLKQLDTNGVSKREQMIEYMEAELTEE